LARFGIVGAIAYVVDAGGYNLLVYGPGHLMAAIPVRAGAVSWAASVLVAWLGSRYWTFARRRGASKRRELLLFVLVNLAGLAVTTVCLYVSRWVLNFDGAFADNLSRNIIGVGLGTILRYVLYKTVVFRGSDSQTPADQVLAGR
jgi:putative flippase GtrA